MTTFAIVHGAGGSAWEWHRTAAELRTRGHDVVAVDLPCEDESAGLADYAAVVTAAVRDHTQRSASADPGGAASDGEHPGGAARDGAEPDATGSDGEQPGGAEPGLVVVAHSLGGFTAPLVCEHLRVDRLVLVAAMVPLPGERGRDWWETSGYQAAAREGAERDGVALAMDDDAGLVATFMHDVEPRLAAEALRRSRHQSVRPMTEPWPLAAWPDVPTSYLVFADDRFFRPDFLRAMARERLGVEADEMPGSHAGYLSHPAELALRLERYAHASHPATPRAAPGP
ncbi:alpha/beta fold hydrolase [Georgenia sp. SYP-B2076]|uniref:alpha/beta fold hydrolase n=1 Tax=Georgenia sp. SYP-B2076 TaxID=2495881 RepID=UPI000F8E4E66|nr:alpha/beta hydrolase [Georgenia sp. SYP-B2076]